MPAEDDVKGGVASAFFRPVMLLWASRDERKAVKLAGKLRFWRDGMMPKLDKIARGDFVPKDLVDLEQAFYRSQDGAEEAINQLNDLRYRLSGSKAANLIDAVVNDEAFGKAGIRCDIDYLLATWRGSDQGQAAREEASLTAAHLRNRVRGFNASLDRLHRLVYDQ